LLRLSLALAVACLAAPPCPDLSGTYVRQGEDGQVHISIQQHGCDRIRIRRNTNYLGATINVEEHLLKLNGSEQRDSAWFGGSEPYRTSAKFVGSELQVHAKSAGGTAFTMFYSLTPDRDLLEEGPAKGLDRQVPDVAKRQK
jgi:hypothetical protein